MISSWNFNTTKKFLKNISLKASEIKADEYSNKNIYKNII